MLETIYKLLPKTEIRITPNHTTKDFCKRSTVVPPSSEPDGEIAFHTLKEQGLPVLEQGIQRLKVYEHASAEGKPIYEIKRGGKKAWEDWKELAKLEPIKDLLT